MGKLRSREEGSYTACEMLGHWLQSHSLLVSRATLLYLITVSLNTGWDMGQG